MLLCARSRACGALLVVLGIFTPVAAPRAQTDRPGALPERPQLAEARRLFYNARYEAAAALALESRSGDTPDLATLASHELRSSAILFQLKALLEGPNGRDESGKDADKKAKLTACATCPALIEAFFDDVRRGQTLARAMLEINPTDDATLFYLGKLDLNYVWLQLGPLGKRTGWDEFWEARRSLDAVIKHQPAHVRAVVARAWIDYIVDTKMPWGTAWMLGGGNKKRALTAVRAASEIESDVFSHAEAEFALWNMLVRERKVKDATVVARRLAVGFPENPEVAAYLQARSSTTRR